MTRLPSVTSTQLARVLRHLGFELLRQKGSHAYYQHLDGRTTVLPVHRGEDIGRGLLRAILRDIEISPDQFNEIRKKV